MKLFSDKYIPLFVAIFNVLCIIVMLILGFTILGYIDIWYIFIPIFLMLLITIINVFNIVYPHVNAIKYRKQNPELYSYDSIKYNMRASLAAKLTAIPLIVTSILVYVFASAASMLLGALSASLFLFPVAILLLLGTIPITLGFIMGTLVFYAFTTSFNITNSVVFMMAKRKIKVLQGLLYILLLALPVTDFILTSFVLPRYLKDKQLKYSTGIFISLIPYILLSVAVYLLVLIKGFQFAIT